MKKATLFMVALAVMQMAIAQKSNWQNLDLQADSVFGISTEKAFKELLSGKKAVSVRVAVIDNGVDTAHEDLKNIIWTNAGEIPGNKLDDDHNGYVDDMHGWNFLGSEIGVEDITHLARPDKLFYDSLSLSKVPEQYRAGYQAQREFWDQYQGHADNGVSFLSQTASTRSMLEQIVQKIGKAEPVAGDFRNYTAANDFEKRLCIIVSHRLPMYNDFSAYKKRELDDVIEAQRFHNEHGLNWQYDPNDELWKKSLTRHYGDNDVSGPATLKLLSPGADHGTHVAGIIAGERNNGIGINGVADHVSIMPVRIMSFYRELRDYDLANAIRYATDNEARIINISFGKPYTWNKKEVDAAVKYAMGKGVLIVHAAMNAGANIDEHDQYPNAYYADSSGRADAWIEVGASGMIDDSHLAADFSNYGAVKVDVFAPGVKIYSTMPNSKYEAMDGTSMAAPVVAGLAALIMEYYPKLTAIQVKDIIMKSVVKREALKGKCVSGGVVNAYNALKLAASYK